MRKNATKKTAVSTAVAAAITTNCTHRPSRPNCAITATAITQYLQMPGKGGTVANARVGRKGVQLKKRGLHYTGPRLGAVAYVKQGHGWVQVTKATKGALKGLYLVSAQWASGTLPAYIASVTKRQAASTKAPAKAAKPAPAKAAKPAPGNGQQASIPAPANS